MRQANQIGNRINRVFLKNKQGLFEKFQVVLALMNLAQSNQICYSDVDFYRFYQVFIGYSGDVLDQLVEVENVRSSPVTLNE
ncbi:MAG: hypothetical protein ABIH70_10685 [Chloroflexota bacterium]